MKKENKFLYSIVSMVLFLLVLAVCKNNSNDELEDTQERDSVSKDIMSERIIERLRRYNHPYYYEHITYQGAGHYFAAPGMPTTYSDKITFALDSTMLLGGNPYDNAAAWERVKVFFKKYLGSMLS